MDRAAWLAARRGGIGASDAAAVCGLSPWKGPLDVYLDKMGLLPESMTEPQRWGLMLEDVVAAAYEEERGCAVQQPHSPIWRHREYPWMLATLDRISADGRLVELKTSRTAEGWGHAGTDEVPESYLVQVQHQMAVADVQVADVAVLIGGSDFRVYPIARSQQLIDKLIMIEADFWLQLSQRRPPPIDWTHPRTPELVQLLHRPDGAEVIDLDGEAMHLVREMEFEAAAIRAAEKHREECKAYLAEMMGSAGIGRLPDGREVVRREVTRKGYEVKESRFMETRIRKGRRA